MLASEPMKIRALVLSSLRVVAFGGGLAACGGAQGKLAVDTPVLPYQAPDISDITGIDEDQDEDSDDSGSGSATPAPPPAAGSAAGSGSAAAPGK